PDGANRPAGRSPGRNANGPVPFHAGLREPAARNRGRDGGQRYDNVVRGQGSPSYDRSLEPISHFFYSHRLKLQFWDWGMNGKPPLLLVHGGLDHARN